MTDDQSVPGVVGESYKLSDTTSPSSVTLLGQGVGTTLGFSNSFREGGGARKMLRGERG